MPKKELSAIVDSKGKLQELIYKKNNIDSLVATRNQGEFTIELVSKLIDTSIAKAEATIESSLFLDGTRAGLPAKYILKLAEIFGWDIDFAQDIRPNDQLTVVYEKLYAEGVEFGTGDILSAKFTNQGHTHTAVRFKHKDGSIKYYTPDGNSMRKTFLRSPVDFARISSHFNLKRKHPVLNRIRAHKGVDYAAKTGTPIKTTGDGKIIFRGRKGGYGRVVIVQHANKYTTLYAHLSKYKKGQHVGSIVEQGQTVGYVGQSGLATGPHLHYEFRINGQHKNPLKIKLAHTEPIKPSLLTQFKAQTKYYVDQLGPSLLARNDH
ncbi:MAG: peptidoglycan DD-metalloendopeptidase family protein [Methylococcales bacterium]|nr:peptidoglycan DD-metalloendopeptidase family protein [Methylococcales bacterium]